MFRRTSSAVTNASTQGVTLRGLGGNASSRALVTLDGVPLADPFGGWIPWSALSLGDVGSVRITRGGGSVAAGEGALSGVIELARPHQRAGFSARADVNFGSFNSIDASEQLGWRGGRWVVSVGALARRSNGYRLVAADHAGPADIAAAGHSRAVNAVIRYAPGSATTIMASALVYDEAKSNGFAISSNADRGSDFALHITQNPRQGWAAEAIAWHKMRNFSSGFASADATRTVVTLNSVQDAVPATGSGARIELRPALPKRWTMRLGGEVRFSRGETQERFAPVSGVFTKRRTAGGAQQVIGGFAETSFAPSAALTLSTGARYDTWRQEEGQRNEWLIVTNANTLSARYPARYGGEWTGRISGQLQISPALTVRTAAYSGWRLPTLNELYRPFRVGTIITESNAALNPEHLRGLDAGAVLTPGGAWRIALTGFLNGLDDAIINATTSTSAGGIINQRRENIPHMRSLGLEAAAHGALGTALSVDASLSYAEATIRAPSALAGKQLAQTPRWQSSATLNYGAPRKFVSGALTIRHVSRAYDDDLNSRVLPGFVSLDVALRARLSSRIALSLRAENITDARIVSAVSATGVQSVGAPRLISVGLGVVL